MLSHPKVIETLNKDFIPFELNLTEQPFPESMSALKWLKFAHGILPLSKAAFTTLSVISPDGKKELAMAESAVQENWKKSEHYQSDKFLTLLKTALEKHQKAEKK